jgi:hypothetical protein
MAWSLKEDEMKYAKYLCFIILPLVIFAQEHSKVVVSHEMYSTSKIDTIDGCVMAIEGNAVFFEEEWFYLADDGFAVSSENPYNIDDFEDLKAPFWADLGIVTRNSKTYIKSIRLIKQFKYDKDYGIVGYYNKKASSH